VTSAEAEEMIAACAENEVRLMIAYRLHFEEMNLSAVELVHGGKLGEPRFFSSTFAMQVKKENIRTKRARGGGPLHDVGVYCINAARYLFRAEPVEVTAMAASKKGDDRFREIDEQVSAVMRFPGDRLAAFTCSFGAYDHSSYVVVGTKGRLTADPAYDFAADLSWKLEAGAKTREKTFKKRDQVAPEIIELAACIREGRDPEPSGHEGLADLRVIEAVSRSLETGRTARVEPVERRRRPSRQQERKVKPHDMPELVDAEPPGRD
jgi:predicted dehydrogenase